MGIWNFIGLASKKDIENINMQMDKIKELIGISVTSNEEIKKNNSNLKQKMLEELYLIEDNMISMKAQLEENIEDIKNSNILNSKELVQMLEENKESTIELMSLLKYENKEISEIKKCNETYLKQCIKEFKDNKNNVDSLNKDLEIIQQMIRVVWVNDIVDTLDHKLVGKK